MGWNRRSEDLADYFAAFGLNPAQAESLMNRVDPKTPLRGRPKKRLALTVRLDLTGAKPPIWRRLRLASDLNLEQLHTIIQVAMGWHFAHLQSFEEWAPAGGHRDRLGLATRWDESEHGATEHGEWSVQVSQVLGQVGDRLKYVYDFGDDWHHTLRLEKVEPWTPGDPLAACLKGRRACPPEDSGGIWGLGDFLARQDREGDADDDYWAYLPGWDPEDFDLADVNDALLRHQEQGFADAGPF
ncbi:MAG: plasmid pRiA4b ORF-3 family protein [Bifidobacteriaceae bacterium]|jgi:hypothetical protein|nr:plasmid pRiA4b ORF-3 family protein [Bifidobacteriaceae bacterium]